MATKHRRASFTVMRRQVVTDNISAMLIDSPPAPLPLAQALIAWSDPSLIEAIRRETAKLTPELLDARSRFTLESILVERRMPNRMLLSFTWSDGVESLDREWQRLFARFRLLVEQEVVVLEGTDATALSGNQRVRIPAARAAQLDIDAPAGAVHLSFRTYLNVTAHRPGDAQVASGSVLVEAADAFSRDDVGEAPEEADDSATEDTVPAVAGIPRGRASYGPLIAEAVSDCFDSVHQAVIDVQSWTTIAIRLRKHLERKYPNLVHLKKIPVAETIRTRVERFYQEELARRDVL